MCRKPCSCVVMTMFSEEAPKPEDTTDATKPADAREGETAATTQGKSKKSTKDEQIFMTNIESLYFADTFLFQGLLLAHPLWSNSMYNYFLTWVFKVCGQFLSRFYQVIRAVKALIS